jgi:hypothetical protein
MQLDRVLLYSHSNLGIANKRSILAEYVIIRFIIILLLRYHFKPVALSQLTLQTLALCIVTQHILNNIVSVFFIEDNLYVFLSPC